jgi:hypothetical protein
MPFLTLPRLEVLLPSQSQEALPQLAMVLLLAQRVLVLMSTAEDHFPQPI